MVRCVVFAAVLEVFAEVLPMLKQRQQLERKQRQDNKLGFEIC
jgi:hypothetical protein